VTDKIITALAMFETLASVREFTNILTFDWKSQKVSAAA